MKDDNKNKQEKTESKAESNKTESNGNLYPVLPLRDVVIYPKNVTSLFVGRKKSMRALDLAKNEYGNKVLLVAQKDATDENPSHSKIYKTGTLSDILQIMRFPDSTYKLLVEGQNRVRVNKYHNARNCLMADVVAIEEVSDIDKTEVEALMRSMSDMLGQYAKLNKKVPHELLVSASSMDDPRRFADMLSAYMPLKLKQKQGLLETDNVRTQFEVLMKVMEIEMDILDAEKSIRDRVKQQMEKNQREYYMNEQIKAIRKELGQGSEAPKEFEEYEKKITKAKMPKTTKARAKTELNKLNMMSSTSAEATVVRNYLDWLVSMPWRKKTRLKETDLNIAHRILDEDHFGLDKVKERILEYLAVQQRVKKIKGPILCLVGPPGVGKTSLGRSIARATGRKFVRMSLGGVRDEAEIRGHRRTYIGSMPGKFIQNLSKAGVRNPLFLLDEIDKMSSDIRGDPASALLEVLDPEQNSTFQDHYLEVEFDLSDVMFVCTANSMNIPSPLLDRMEVISLSGYTEQEKRRIAQDYLIPRQIVDNGLQDDEIRISDTTMRDIIRYYTREAGVRNLERQISKICRKVVKKILTGKITKKVNVGPDSLEKYLGVRQYRYGLAFEQNSVGQVTGMAWTESGGDLLTIEAAVVPGTGKLSHTGKLGEVMQESVSAAMTVVRSRVESLGIPPDFYQKNDIHVHVPEGGVPKDGPSAGIAICTAMVSALTKVPVRADFAMTGEIRLHGEVLPIGGLREKLLAALRGGIKTVLIPKENEKDLKEIPKNIKSKLDIRCVQWIDEVLQLAMFEDPYKETGESKKAEEGVSVNKKPTRIKDEENTSHKAH